MEITLRFTEPRRRQRAALFVTRGEGAFDVRVTPEFEKLLLPALASASPVESAP